VILKAKKPSVIRFWWFWYLLSSDSADFKHNFTTAWSQKESEKPLDTFLFVDESWILVPLRFSEEPASDRKTIQQLKLFYRLLKVSNGLAELLIPKRLEEIIAVKVSKLSLINVVQ